MEKPDRSRAYKQSRCLSWILNLVKLHFFDIEMIIDQKPLTGFIAVIANKRTTIAIKSDHPDTAHQGTLPDLQAQLKITPRNQKQRTCFEIALHFRAFLLLRLNLGKFNLVSHNLSTKHIDEFINAFF